MRVKCSYCGDYIEDTLTECPNCGAVNEQLRRNGYGIPQTIEELKRYAAQNNIPLSQMRFFLDYDIKEARAYGIYKDEAGNFVVYKNKSNGERVIRYKGSDEAYAVNEIYQKLRTEMAEQKLYQAQNLPRSYQPDYDTYNSESNHSESNPSHIIGYLFVIIMWVLALSSLADSCSSDSSNHNHSYSHSYYNYDSGYDYDYNDYGSRYSYDEWDYGWDDNDWDYDFDWDSGYSNWDSDW